MKQKESGFDNIALQLKRIPAEIRLYIEKRIELTGIILSEQLSDSISKAGHKIAGVLVLLIGVDFALIALAIFLGDLLNNLALGFFLTALPFLIAGLLFINLKPARLIDKTRDQILTGMLETVNKLHQKPIDSAEQKQLSESKKTTN